MWSFTDGYACSFYCLLTPKSSCWASNWLLSFIVIIVGCVHDFMMSFCPHNITFKYNCFVLVIFPSADDCTVGKCEWKCRRIVAEAIKAFRLPCSHRKFHYVQGKSDIVVSIEKNHFNCCWYGNDYNVGEEGQLRQTISSSAFVAESK